MKKFTSRIVKLFVLLILLLNLDVVYANDNLFDKVSEVNKYSIDVAYNIIGVNGAVTLNKQT